MGDTISVTPINAFVQENGIIRLADTGLFLGRLDGVEYESLAPYRVTDKKNKVEINADDFEHLLNCMCNQKFIHEMNAETQKEWQEIIDKAYHEARLLQPRVSEEVTV